MKSGHQRKAKEKIDGRKHWCIGCSRNDKKANGNGEKENMK